MVVNEFAQLLEAEVRRVNHPGLWVLMSNGPLEVPHVSRSDSRSAFGYFVTEGLAGAADRDGDGVVELHELVEYVRQGVAGWVDRESSGAETQTPWLLHGGEGSANAPAGLALLPGLGFRPPGHGRPGRASAARRCRQSGEARASRCCSPPGRDAASCPVRGGVAAPRPDRAVLRRGAGRPRSITHPICGGRTRSCCWATSSVGAAAGSTIRHNWPTTCGPTSCR